MILHTLPLRRADVLPSLRQDEINLRHIQHTMAKTPILRIEELLQDDVL